MKQLVTKGIVLSRTDYGEADRIITLLTPDYGKLRLVARGVRKIKSKLAGGIELFSVSDITFMQGRGDLGTLISARLIDHYGFIVQDIERVQLGYDLIKITNRATEDSPETEYFELLQQAFIALNSSTINSQLIKAWYDAQLLKQAGHQPNLTTNSSGGPLDPAKLYNFDFESVCFAEHPGGHFTANHIKTLRLIFSVNKPVSLQQVGGINELIPGVASLLKTMLGSYISQAR